MSEQADWFRRVESLYQAALDEPVANRLDFVRCAAAGDVALQQEVEALLKSYAAADKSFLDLPAHALREPVEADSRFPERVGRFRIIEKLGEGGMGLVYRAEQDNPRREVALKMVRPGTAGRDALRRFELEAALLARLKHPGIAQIYEAGMHDDGSGMRPYFAMELVDGPPLMHFIRTSSCDLTTKLELMAAICDAVQYAHQKGIIHRDLKPSNILLVPGVESPPRDTPPTAVVVRRPLSSEFNGGIAPKILDFGVARATDSDLQTTTLHTEVGQIIGTLPYMSPEQIAGDGRDLDTRTDVYALGVILYEILTGRVPIDVDRKSIAAAARLICDHEPSSPGTVNRALRGDLDAIVLKALEKDPERRYQSAADLGADLRRHVRNEPIAARRTTTIYQLRKFARRNRGLVAGVACALVILLVGVLVSTSLAVSRTRALAASERHREIAEAVNDFLNKDLLGQANPYQGAAHDAKLRDILDSAAETIDSKFSDKPLVHASIRATLGRAYYQLGVYDAVEKHLPPAIDIYTRELGLNDPISYDLRHTRIVANLQAFHLQEAEQQVEESLALANQYLAANHEMTGQLYGDLGILRKRQGRFAESEQAYRRSLEIFHSLEQPPQRKIAITTENLGLVIFDQNRDTEAEELLRRAVEQLEQLTGPDSADLAYGLTNLGQVYKQSRPRPEGLRLAKECHERAYEIRKRRLGENHRETLRTQGCLAMTLDDEGNHIEAERIHREVLQRRLRIMEVDHIDVLDARYQLGRSLEHQGRHEEAIELYRLSIQAGQARYGPEYYHVRRFRWGLAALLRKLDDHACMHDFFKNYFAALEDATAPDDAAASNLNAYAYWLMNCDTECMRNAEKALVLARRAHQVAAPDNPNVVHTLAQALVENGQPDEAVTLLEQALSQLNPTDATRRAAIEEQVSSIRSAILADGSSNATH